MPQDFKKLLSELEMLSFHDRISTGNKTTASSALLADFFETLPFPAWIKVLDDEGKLRMAYVNEAYERHVGISVTEYFSKEDAELGWRTEELEQFQDNDQHAIDTRAPIPTAEVTHDPSGSESVWKGHKWPIIRNDGVIAVCGYALLPVNKEA